jgi:anti-sigma factor RsiW
MEGLDAMKCQTIRHMISDGELGEAQRRIVDEHVERCAECRAFAALVGGLGEDLASLVPVPEPRPGFAMRVVARLPDDEPGQSPLAWLAELLRPVPVALATASLALGVFLASNMTGQTPPADGDMLLAELFDIPPYVPGQGDGVLPSEEH